MDMSDERDDVAFLTGSNSSKYHFTGFNNIHNLLQWSNQNMYKVFF